MPNNTIVSSSNSNLYKVRMLLLLSFVPLMGMSIDLFAPSLPSLSLSLNISSSVTKLVISMFILGYAMGNFVVGLMTDALGRKSLLRISCVMFVISSTLPIFFPNEVVLIASRFLQGVFIGAIGVVNRGIFSDTLSTEKLIKLGPTMGFLWGLGPIVGPIIGGFLQHYYGWKSGFYFFSIVAGILMVLVFILIPETIEKKSKLSFSKIKKDITEVISNAEFMSLTLIMGIAYSLIISFNTLGPFLIQDVMNYSALYFGKLAIFLGLAFLPAPIICRRLLNHFPINKIFFVVIHFFMFMMLIFLITSFFYRSNIALLVAATMAVYFMCGSIFPLSMGKGISMLKHISGTAAAVMYLVNMLITCFVAFIQSYIHADNIVDILVIYVCLIFIILLIYWRKLRTI